MVYLFNSDVTLKATPQLDAFGRLRTSTPQTLFDSQQRFALDRSFVSNTASGGSVTFIPTQSSANLTVTSTNGSFSARESRYVFKYQPGKSQLALLTFVMAPQSSGNLRQRIGYFGTDNGMYLELSDQLYFVKRSNVTGTVTNTPVAQSAWNYDTLTGSGPSGISLDQTKAQILFFDMEWLGVGSVRCGFVINGQYVLAHTFHHANIASSVYITTACLPVRYEIQTIGGSAPATSNLTQICCSVASEAGYNEPLTLFSNQASLSSTSGSWTPVISMRLMPGRLDAISTIKQVDLALTSAQSGSVQWAVWSSSNITGATFSTPPRNGSIQIAQGGTINVSSSWQLASGLVTVGGGNATIASLAELGSYFAQIGRDSFTQTSDVTSLAVFGLGSTPSGYAVLSWQELL